MGVSKHTKETKKKISESRKGISAWNKGISYRAGIPKSWKSLQDDKNPSWKGSKVGYRGLHLWVVKHLGKPDTCSHCRLSFTGHKMHWANKSGKYLRVLSDWIRLCAKCHGQHDATLRANKMKTI